MRSNRSLSPWIWRRFGASYRNQKLSSSSATSPLQSWGFNSSTNLYSYQTPAVGVVAGPAYPLLSTYRQVVAASGGNEQMVSYLNAGGGGYTGPRLLWEHGGQTAAQSDMTNYFGIPSPSRRVAVKAITGCLDLFPVAITLSLGDVLYCHVSLHRCRAAGGAVGSGAMTAPGPAVGWQTNPPIMTETGTNEGSVFAAPMTLIPSAVNLFDLDGNRPLFYRRHLWYYGSFAAISGAVAVQSQVYHLPMKIRFRRPLVLDVQDVLVLQVCADLQPSNLGILGQYYVSIVPYLSFLMRNLG